MKNTKIEYMYRDASNYKFHGEFVVKSKLRAKDIKSYLHDEEFFIPHKIGLDHLLNLPINQDDHYLHTFESFEKTDDINCICSAKELIQKIKTANNKGWFSTLSGWAHIS